jgi:hypothetical protein
LVSWPWPSFYHNRYQKFMTPSEVTRKDFEASGQASRADLQWRVITMSVHNGRRQVESAPVTGDIGKSIFPIFPVNVPLPADTVAPALDAPTATPAPTSRPPACTQGEGTVEKSPCVSIRPISPHLSASDWEIVVF